MDSIIYFSRGVPPRETRFPTSHLSPFLVYDDIVVAYQQGRVAMTIEGAPPAGLIFDPQKSRVIGKSGFAIHHKSPAGRFAPQTTHSLMITASSKQRDLAWELILFLASRDMQFKNAIDGKGTPVTRISVMIAWRANPAGGA